MKETMPLAVMQHAGAGEKLVTTPSQGARTAAFGAVSSATRGADGAVPGSFANLLSAGSTQSGAALSMLTGGKTLPLAAQTANTGPDAGSMHSPAVSAQDMLALAVHPEQPSLEQVPGKAPDDLATPAGLTRLIANTPPELTAASSLPAAKHGGEGLVAQTEAASVQLEQMLGKAADKVPGGLQQTLPAPVLASGALRQGPAIKANMSASSRIPEQAGTPQLSRSDTLLNETDQSFTSRMQTAAKQQLDNLAGYRFPDHAVNTVPGAAGDALQTALTRSPLPQAMTGDSASAPVQSSMTEAFGRPEWSQGMGKQVLWMVNQGLSRAEIRLNPANLGPLEVRIDMENDQVNVAFTSRHADVREAVEQALPRLREMLEEKGLKLADADVSQHSFAEQHRQALGDTEGHRNGYEQGLHLNGDEHQPAVVAHAGELGAEASAAYGQGLVDYYI